MKKITLALLSIFIVSMLIAELKPVPIEKPADIRPEFLTRASNTCITADAYPNVNDAPVEGDIVDPYDEWWYSFTASGNSYENVVVSLCGSAFDTKLEIWWDCSDPSYAYYNDDSCGLQSEIAISETMPAGATWYAKVYGYSSSTGHYILTITGDVLPPVTLASNPTPANGEGNVHPDADLSWVSGSPMTGERMFFGTNPIIENNPLIDPVSSPYDPGTMPEDTWHYWRVDTQDGNRDWQIGGEWSFMTTGCRCLSTYTDLDDDWIDWVIFNTIDNNSGYWNQDGPLSYTDHSNLYTTVVGGDTHDLYVNIGTNGGWIQHCWAWIDWNDDCIFDTVTEGYDLGEIQGDSSIDSWHSLTLPITIPTGLTPGPRFMRILEQYSSDPDPCDGDPLHDVTYGNTEDYTIIIGGGTLGVPQNITISHDGVNVNLDWDDVAGASGYYVYYSADPYATPKPPDPFHSWTLLADVPTSDFSGPDAGDINNFIITAHD